MDLNDLLDRYKCYKGQQKSLHDVQASSYQSFNCPKVRRLPLLSKTGGSDGMPVVPSSYSAGCTIECGYKFSRNSITSMLHQNPEKLVNKYLSYAITHIINQGQRKGFCKKFLKHCKYWLYLIGEIHQGGLKVNCLKGRPIRTRHEKHGIHVVPCTSARSYRESKKLVLKVIWSTLYLKSLLTGFRLRFNILYSLVKRVHRLVHYKIKHEREWTTIDIIAQKRGRGKNLLGNGANFIANVFCRRIQELPSHILLKTTLSSWNGFKHKYSKQMFHILLLLNCLAADEGSSCIVENFKALIDRSLNAYLFTVRDFEGSSGEISLMSYHLYQFYGILNDRRHMQLEKAAFSLHSYNLEWMISAVTRDNKGNDLWKIKWLIMVVMHLLQSKREPRSKTWIAIQLMAQYFLEGGLNCSLVRCRSSKPCLRCVMLYAEISGGLYSILKCLRGTELYPFHVALVKILLKNDISKLFAAFGSVDKRFYDAIVSSNESMSEIKQESKKILHKTPKTLSYAAALIKQRYLMKVERKGMSIKPRQNRVDTYLPYPIYLKLLFAVHNNLSGVKVIENVDRVLKSRQRYNTLDRLAPYHVRKVLSHCVLRTTARGRLILPGFMAILAHIYLHNKGMDDCLSELVVQNQLNTMQRTQACHVLAKNPSAGVLPLALPQLIQSLSLDPGSRIWYLLLVAMADYYFKERAPYLAACMVHHSKGKANPSKAIELLEFILNDSSGCFEHDQVRRNIQMHSQLLKLTVDLAKVEPDKRKETLMCGIQQLNEAIKDIGPIKLFTEASENGDGPQQMSVKGRTRTNVVLSLDKEEAKVLKSAKRAPCMVDFHLSNMERITYIYKMDDDMRQDALVVQLKTFMLNVFKAYRLETYLQPFLVVPYSSTLSEITNSDCRMFSASKNQEEEHSTPARITVGANHTRVNETNKPVDKSTGNPYGLLNLPRWASKKAAYIRDLGMKYKVKNRIKNEATEAHMLGGIVGFIPGTISRHAMGQAYNMSLYEYFVQRFGKPGLYRFNCAMENFITSLAGYSLLCFLLQIKDRHNGNLLISPHGHIIHIDFGFILGASPAADVTFEYAPFKLTKEMIELLGGVDSDNFHRYVRLLVCSYLAVRQESEAFIATVKLMEHSGIESFRRKSVAKLKRRFYLDTTPENAANYMIRRIHVALHSKTTKLYDLVQGWQQGIQY